jgi:hypothetical protein
MIKRFGKKPPLQCVGNRRQKGKYIPEGTNFEGGVMLSLDKSA